MLRALYSPSELRVQLGTYDVGAARRAGAQALNAVAIAGVAYVFVGKASLDFMGVAEPQPLADFRENKLIGLGGYFALNFLATQLKQSGAFEVAVDGASAFSKLATGRPPAVDEVLVALAAAGAKHNADAASRLDFSFLNGAPPHAFGDDEEAFETVPVAAAA